jgi:hypothetical protein
VIVKPFDDHSLANKLDEGGATKDTTDFTVADPSVGRQGAAATAAPKRHGADRHGRCAEGKCCSNCNHHFAHGTSPWIEFDHRAASLKSISAGANAAFKDETGQRLHLFQSYENLSCSVSRFAI